MSSSSMITNSELAILGLVAEGPSHGYQIEQVIELRGMREWTEIGFSSIYYILNKLEASGLLESSMDVIEEEPAGRPARGTGRSSRSAARAKRGPARKVYTLTGSGWEAYREAVRQRLADPRPRSADFALGLANLPALTPAQSRAALEAQRAALAERLRRVQAKKEEDRQATGGELPPHVEALFDYSTAVMAAEFDWLQDYLNSASDRSSERDE